MLSNTARQIEVSRPSRRSINRPPARIYRRLLLNTTAHEVLNTHSHNYTTLNMCRPTRIATAMDYPMCLICGTRHGDSPPLDALIITGQSRLAVDLARNAWVMQHHRPLFSPSQMFLMLQSLIRGLSPMRVEVNIHIHNCTCTQPTTRPSQMVHTFGMVIDPWASEGRGSRARG